LCENIGHLPNGDTATRRRGLRNSMMHRQKLMDIMKIAMSKNRKKFPNSIEEVSP
jgi:hypothetical protein